MNNCYNLLGQHAHWQINKEIARAVGLDAALLLSDLISKRQYFLLNGDLTEGWFFNTQSNIELDTTLSEFQQRKAISKLVGKGFISVEKKGLPARYHFMINDDLLLNFLTTSALKSEALGLKKVKHINKNKVIRINKEKIAGTEVPAEPIFSLHTNCVEYWCKVYKPDYVFDGGKDGKSIKKLYGNIKQSMIRKKGSENISDKEVFEAFKMFCSNIKNIDKFYHNMDIASVCSQYNPITEKIKAYLISVKPQKQTVPLHERELTEMDFQNEIDYQNYLKLRKRFLNGTK